VWSAFDHTLTLTYTHAQPTDTPPHHTTPRTICVCCGVVRVVLWSEVFSVLFPVVERGVISITHTYTIHTCVNHTHSHYSHIYTHIIHTDLNHTHSHYSRTNHRHAASTFFFYRITDLYCQGCVDMCGLVCVVDSCIVQWVWWVCLGSLT